MRGLAPVFAVACATLLPACGLGLDEFGETGGGTSSGDCTDNSDLKVVPTDGLDFGEVSAWDTPQEDALTLGGAPGSTHAVVVTDASLDPDFARAFDVEFAGAVNTPVRIASGKTVDLNITFPSSDYQNTGSTGSYTGQLVLTYEVNAAGDTCQITRALTGTLCADSGHDGNCD